MKPLKPPRLNDGDTVGASHVRFLSNLFRRCTIRESETLGHSVLRYRKHGFRSLHTNVPLPLGVKARMDSGGVFVWIDVSYVK